MASWLVTGSLFACNLGAAWLFCDPTLQVEPARIPSVGSHFSALCTSCTCSRGRRVETEIFRTVQCADQILAQIAKLTFSEGKNNSTVSLTLPGPVVRDIVLLSLAMKQILCHSRAEDRNRLRPSTDSVRKVRRGFPVSNRL